MLVYFLFAIFILLAIACVLTTQQDPIIRGVNEKYTLLLVCINGKEKDNKFYDPIRKRIPLTFYRTRKNDLGYNVNKGYEIGLCVDGTVNDVFHVLIHELAHSLTDVYTHDETFWKNFDILKDLCIREGLYESITQKKSFCGKYIQD